MKDSLSARNLSSLTSEKFVRVETKLTTILATLSSHLLWSFKKICLVVHNSVSKTANQSASFQPRDDHEPNTYPFLANQSDELRLHDALEKVCSSRLRRNGSYSKNEIRRD